MRYSDLDSYYITKFLRYCSHSPNESRYTYMPLRHIAKHLNRSISYVQMMCKDIIKDDMIEKGKLVIKPCKRCRTHKPVTYNPKKFNKEQIKFLTNIRTLYAWATKSLEERLCLFKRRYPQSQTTVYKLRKLYAKFMSRKKCIRPAKIPSRPSLEDITI